MIRPKRKSIPKKVREQVYQLCNGHCAYCGCEITMKEMQVDHFLAIENGVAIANGRGEVDSQDNYLPACRSCNYYKSSMFLDQFRAMVFRWPDILLRDSVTFRNAVRFGQVTITQHDPKFYYEEIGVKIPAMDWYEEFIEPLRKAREKINQEGKQNEQDTDREGESER